MSPDRAIEVTETHPPPEGAPWDDFGESLVPDDGAEPASFEAEAQGGPATPQPRRWRLLPRSLSSRLVVFVVALVVAVVSVAGCATYISLKSFLYNRLDQQLTGQSDPEHLTTYFQRGSLPDSPFLRGPQEVWAIALNTSGVVIKEPPRLLAATMTLSSGQRTQLLGQRNGSPQTITTQDGKHLRILVRSAPAVNLATGQEETAVVIVGLSTSEVDRTLHRVILIEIAIGTLAVLLALIVTSWGVRLSLRPLSRVTRTAREVTAELSPDGAGLDRRVPVADPETEVGQLGESFNTLMGTVETQFAARLESEQRMRQFLADASHELRTPLTSIRGYAELSRMRGASDEAEYADTMDRIESEGTRMSRLVDDLLLLARSDRGAPPEREPVDVGELIEDAVDGARSMYPQRRIDAVAPAGVTVLADHDQLLRVLRNLITNAVVHTAPDGPIQVSGHFAGDEVVLRAADSGPGLPPDEAQHVFERFWRADKARSRARGGSGLGLAIVASIVQAHGGTVGFESTVETGSTVTVRLPVTPPVAG